MTAARKVDPASAIRVARETLLASRAATDAALALLDVAEAGAPPPAPEPYTFRLGGELTPGEFDAAVRRHRIPTFRVGRKVACKAADLRAALEAQGQVRRRAPRRAKIDPQLQQELDDRAAIEAIGIPLRRHG